MLVLSRRIGEKVVLTLGGLEIVVCVVENRGYRVRLGFQAPAEVVIVREEVDGGQRPREAAP